MSNTLYPDPNLFTEYCDGQEKNKAFELFAKKVTYRQTILQTATRQGINNIVDFNNGFEKILYGRVNERYMPVAISNKEEYLSYIPNEFLADHRATLKAPVFMMPMFRHLQNTIKARVAQGTIDGTHKYLSDLRIHKAYIDPHVAYRQYLDILEIALKRNVEAFVAGGNSGITDCATFIQFLYDTVGAISNVYPLTFSAFMKSRFCPVNCSGLALEIADLKAGNDQKTLDELVNSPNWNFFVKAANSSGFMIDANAPWRLIADVAPEAVKLLTSRFYGVSQPKILFKKMYSLCGYSDISTFVDVLYRMYNAIAVSYMESTLNCNDTLANHRFVEPEKYTLEQFKEVLPSNDLLRVYFEIRFLEEESHFTPQQRQQIIKDSIDLVFTPPVSNVTRAIYYFEVILNKPFDYVGSSSYTFNSRKELDTNLAKMPTLQEIYKESNLGNRGAMFRGGLYGQATDPEFSEPGPQNREIQDDSTPS
tara:strand:- start:842 stop:2278 length:1437 start_codon:yes stop_codon:yes gene_type:complete